MLNVKYNEIDRLRPILATAIKCEKTMYQDEKKDKSASWMMQLVKDADLEMDDYMKKEFGDRLTKKKAKTTTTSNPESNAETAEEVVEEVEAEGEEQVFKKFDDDGSNKRRIKDN
jgi:hypothetical protein